MTDKTMTFEDISDYKIRLRRYEEDHGYDNLIESGIEIRIADLYKMFKEQMAKQSQGSP